MTSSIIKILSALEEDSEYVEIIDDILFIWGTPVLFFGLNNLDQLVIRLTGSIGGGDSNDKNISEFIFDGVAEADEIQTEAVMANILNLIDQINEQNEINLNIWQSELFPCLLYDHYTNKALTQTRLIERGWTASMIKKIYPEPDFYGENCRGKGYRKAKMRYLAVVEAIEGTNKFQNSLMV